MPISIDEAQVLDNDSGTKTVAVTDVTVDGTDIECEIEYTDDIAPFFSSQTFTASYDVDISAVPESVLTVPVLAHLCPVAWALGADVHASSVDPRFLDSLETVGAVLREMYPTFIEGGRVVVEEAPTTEHCGDGAETGLLFTGGVNSLSPYARHRNEVSTLLSIQAWHVGPDEERRWWDWQANVREYADRFGVEAQFVRSNVLDILNSSMLSIHFTDDHDGGWYSAVADGLGLLGLTAPLTVATDIGRLYVGARHWDEFPTPELLDHWDGQGMPWGSHPAIDESLAWAGTDIVHDGFELTRQERVEVVADFLTSHHPDLPVWACEKPARQRNCKQCENCFRTAFGLAVAGRDPNQHGLVLTPTAFEQACNRFEAGEWLPDRHHAVYWQELQAKVDSDTTLPVEGGDTFCQWLQSTDFDTIAGRSNRSRAIRTLARSVPTSLYSKLYSIYGRDDR